MKRSILIVNNAVLCVCVFGFIFCFIYQIIINSLPADIWKQFGPRLDLIESQALSGSKFGIPRRIFLFVCADALHSSQQFSVISGCLPVFLI